MSSLSHLPSTLVCTSTTRNPNIVLHLHNNLAIKDGSLFCGQRQRLFPNIQMTKTAKGLSPLPTFKSKISCSLKRKKIGCSASAPKVYGGVRSLSDRTNQLCFKKKLTWQHATHQRNAPWMQQGCTQTQPETLQAVQEVIANQLSLEQSAVIPQTKFSELGADSLDTVEIMMALEEKFGVSIGEGGAESISTIQDAADLIEKVRASSSAS